VIVRQPEWKITRSLMCRFGKYGTCKTGREEGEHSPPSIIKIIVRYRSPDRSVTAELLRTRLRIHVYTRVRVHNIVSTDEPLRRIHRTRSERVGRNKRYTFRGRGRNEVYRTFARLGPPRVYVYSTSGDEGGFDIYARTHV